jgi:HemY protein
MIELLKTARKKQAAPREKLLEMEAIAAIGSLEDAADGNVQVLFEKQPSHVQEMASVVQVYSQRLVKLNQADPASKAIVKSLNANWNEDLAELYGQVESSDVSAQLDQAEKWTKDNGESVGLLLAVGNLSYRRNLWGKAKDNILRSIAIKPTQAGFFALGKTLEAMDDQNAALEAYKHGYAVNSPLLIAAKAKGSSSLQNPAKINAQKEQATA